MDRNFSGGDISSNDVILSPQIVDDLNRSLILQYCVHRPRLCQCRIYEAHHT
jgi:hypothetical protein